MRVHIHIVCSLSLTRAWWAASTDACARSVRGLAALAAAPGACAACSAMAAPSGCARPARRRQWRSSCRAGGGGVALLHAAGQGRAGRVQPASSLL
uniref:Secreted protein n=1 Tax=Oryza rufipogon TaxID=4529 RepID=A0A0E0PFC6_ORYRU